MLFDALDKPSRTVHVRLDTTDRVQHMSALSGEDHPRRAMCAQRASTGDQIYTNAWIASSDAYGETTLADVIPIMVQIVAPHE